MNSLIDDIKSVIIGHAVGDALGVPVEFHSRDEFKKNKITWMTGYGTYMKPEGTWSDDTSMTIATLDSLGPTIDYTDIMQRFVRWYTGAEYTADDHTFDIGGTTRRALDNYIQGRDYTKCGLSDYSSNGNGSLMRIATVVLYLEYGQQSDLSLGNKLNCIHAVSSLTHGHVISQMACGIYALVLWEILRKPEKESIYRGLKLAGDIYKDTPEIREFINILNYDISKSHIDCILSDGYVVNTLESALYCVLTTDSYEECVLKAVNMGEDTDTTAAVAGSLAGALYGYDSIPTDWIKTLKRSEYIVDICVRAASRWK